ncbi:hypothetical protein OIU35_13265 [Boseaceae bacterium BT-24-1]|nr:hypothetical protein [Boseaceae bacterium BT-24-1]
MGACATSVLARAIARDLFHGEALGEVPRSGGRTRWSSSKQANSAKERYLKRLAKIAPRANGCVEAAGARFAADPTALGLGPPSSVYGPASLTATEQRELCTTLSQEMRCINCKL